MLENLFKKLDTWMGNTMDKALLEQLANIAAPLQFIDSTLPETVVNYVLTGKDAQILQTLQQRPDDLAAALLHKPASLNWWWPHNVDEALLKKSQKLTNQSIKARHQFYQTIAKTDASDKLDIISRFAHLITALNRQQDLVRFAPTLPDWLQYLLIDVFSTSIRDEAKNHNNGFHNHQLEQWRSEMVKTRPGWDVKFLQGMLSSNDIPETQLFYALFERVDVAEYFTENLHPLLTLPGIEGFIEQHAGELRRLSASLSLNGKLTLLRYFKNQLTQAVQFIDVISAYAVDNSKTVRTDAQQLLQRLNTELVIDALKLILTTGSPKARTYAAEVLARYGSASQAVLSAALQQESSKTVQQAIQAALSRVDSTQNAEQQDELQIPAFTPLSEQHLPESATEILLENYRELLEKARVQAEQEIEDNKTQNWRSTWRQNHYKDLQKVGEAKISQYLDIINGKPDKKLKLDEQVCLHRQRLQALPAFNLYHVFRIIGHSQRAHGVNWYHLSQYVKDKDYEHLDLRQLVPLYEQANDANPLRQVAKLCLEHSWNDDGLLSRLQPAQVWPFFAEHPEFIAEALGLTSNQSDSRYYGLETSKALTVLSYFPALPTRFIPRLLELALGEAKTYRLQAQQVLQSLADIRVRAEEALSSSKQEIRVTGTEWLARLGYAESVAVLQAALKKESRETVRAAMLTALEQLGMDISHYLNPDVLLQEAQKGLKAKAPASFAWFQPQTIPALTWQNGTAINPQIIEWWIILACKLKEPAGNALLNRYLSLLSVDSQQRLGFFLLHAFIHQDTRNPSQEEALAEAQKRAPGQLQNYLDWAKRWPEHYANYASYTLEQVIEQIKKEVLGRYLGSAIADKGILALTSGIQGHLAVSILQNYMRDHYQRRAQIEAMLMALANSNDPLIIQLLLSISRRYRTASVQEKARELVQLVAARNGWSSDELADRTIPTAGLDDQGVLSIDYGERQFSAVMDSSYKLGLKNSEGKEIKALPDARKNDDEALIRDSKKQFGNSKKELKQVIDLQTARLYEAMCVNRHWHSADWQEFIAAHPVMNRLIQRLIWQEVIDGEIVNTFRPTEDGSLINAEDDEIELGTDSHIQLAHTALMDAAHTRLWQQHLKDYKVKPLFDQLSHAVPQLENAHVVEEINDRKGWITDTFTLRGALNKLGYQRAQAEDGGFFDHYFKVFSSANLIVNIHFSGNCLPEENLTAVLYELRFEENKGNYWSRKSHTLDQVPPILLAESYADYHKLADACIGFDAEWEKKSPW